MLHQLAQETSAEEINLVQIPGQQNQVNRTIRVYAQGWRKTEFDWEEVDNPSDSRESLFISGDLAVRMMHFLQLYTGGGTGFARYISDPDCHGAAMFTMGVVDYIKRISPKRDFQEIYTRHPATFTYEPQNFPSLVHLLDRVLKPGDIGSFAERNTPHSIIHLGMLGSKEICFEKKGHWAAGFVTIASTER